MPEMELRPYQTESLEQVRARYRAGARRLLVALPTGTGKTVVFARFPGYFRMKKRLLVLAHRRELLEQAREKFLRVDPELSVDIEQAGRRASTDSQVVVASVPTLGRKGSGRLAALDPELFYLIVVDEAHHAVAQTYRRIFDHFGLFEPDSRRLLVGFTATPYRGDGQGLGEVFQEVAYSRSLEEMIARGYLCPVGGWRVTSDVDLAGVGVRAGDFVESQLATRVNVDERNARLVRALQELAPGRRTLVFCVDVAHTRDVADAFCRAGIPAAAVWGAMPRSEREQTLARFSRGELQVVTNCNVLTEGFDEPRVDCVLMARPTHSRLLYAQMVGRGTRLHPDKQDLQVIDVVDNSQRHELRGLHNLFNLPENMSLKGRDARAVAEELRRLERRYPWVDVSRITSPEQIPLAAERIELFSFGPPEELLDLTNHAWHALPGGGYRLSLPKGEAVVVAPTLLDQWEVRLLGSRAQPRPGGSSRSRPRGVLSAHADLEPAIEAADRFVARERSDAVHVVDLSAPWRHRPASDNQLQVLRDRGIPTPKGLTRGQASWMISLALGRRQR
jgi:superfamily II DNA or RNA helicase